MTNEKPKRLVEAGDITIARRLVFGDHTSGWSGPTNEDYAVAEAINRRICEVGEARPAGETPEPKER